MNAIADDWVYGAGEFELGDAMKNKTLIKKLMKLDPEADVFVYVWSDDAKSELRDVSIQPDGIWLADKI